MKNHSPCRWLLVGLFAVLAANPTHSADPKPLVEESLKPFLENKPYLAVAVGVVTPEARPIYTFGTYKVGRMLQRPGSTTIFALGSLTKAYAGVLLADLVRDGKIKLDDPAQKYMPDEFVLPKRGDKPITILDLATHYSGMPVQPDCLEFKGNPYANLTPALIAKDLAAAKLESDPGTKYEYSNYGAGLLGHALAKAASAKSFEEALVARVCNPLGMKDTRVNLSDAQNARLAPGYSKKGKLAEHWRFAMLESCGGLFSTADDQVQFIAANLGIVESPLVAAMKDSQQPRRDTDSKTQRIGLGWHTMPLRRSSPKTIIWHNGGTDAARCFLGFVPDAKVGIVILTNSENVPDGIAIGLLQKLIPE
jgi:serine-type D-Ala-D-Ala carboxypeptidase/endopeptidase